MALRIFCGSGQSQWAAQSVPGGGNVQTVPNVGVPEQFPNADWGQTKGIKFDGPTGQHWPFRAVVPGRVVSGIDYTFCRYLRAKYPDDDILMVRYAAGGQPIAEWLYQEEMVVRLRQTWDEAMASDYVAKWGPACATYFAMAQGEADYLTPGDEWAAQGLSFLDGLRHTGGGWRYPIIGEETRVAWVESPAHMPTSARNADLWRLAARGVSIISAADINTVDGVHADALGLQALGARLFNALEGF